MPPTLSAPFKIVYLTPSVRLFGARQSLRQLVTHLDRERFEPLVVCPRRGDLEEVLREAGIQTRILRLPPWRKGKWLLLRFWWVRALRQLLKEEGARLIHCNEFHSTPYAVAAARALAIPAVAHHRLSITPRQILNYHLEQADRLIVVSKAAGEAFAPWPQIVAKMHVVYNGLDLEAFTADANREKLRHELRLHPDDFLIGQLGLISERKQTHLALDSFDRLAERYPHVHLAIVGSAAVGQEAYAAEAERRAAASPFAERIHFTGFRQDIADVCAALDLNLLISNDEGFGRVIIEAGAFGAPTVGSRVGGIPEVIDDGRSGLLVEGSNAAALAQAVTQAVIQLLENPERYRQLQDCVREKVTREFSIERHLTQIQAIYDELLNPDHKKTH